jgi:ABC-2 type transport system ATP-binding protein
MITATSLTKRYGRVAAVDGVTFTCEPGTITGFLGRNGAGKSTTLRMITGLARPDAGTATIAGKPFAELANPARTVGTLLDAAAFRDGRTGRETLRIACTVTGAPRARAEELLTEVQATADRIVTIDHGRVVASGTQRCLLAGRGQTLEALFLSLTTPKEKVT